MPSRNKSKHGDAVPEPSDSQESYDEEFEPEPDRSQDEMFDELAGEEDDGDEDEVDFDLDEDKQQSRTKKGRSEVSQMPCLTYTYRC